MEQIADLIAYDKDGQIALIVEIKNKLKTSRDWAAKMRRNMLAHGLIPRARFFLLASPDRFYLWKDSRNGPEAVEPTYEIDPIPLLQPYYEKSGLSPGNLSGQSFELIVISWLNEIMRSDMPSSPVKQDQDQKWLTESGLLETIKGGHINLEVSV